MNHFGHCLCGAIQFEITGPMQHNIHCYCSMCQRAHGSDYSAWVTCKKVDFKLLQGAEAIKTFSSSPGVERSFCQHCGSNLFWHDDSDFNKNNTAFAIGLLDNKPEGLELIEYFKPEKV